MVIMDVSEKIWLHVGKTTINTWKGTGYSDNEKTWWLASVADGGSYYDPASGLTTRQISADMTSAIVSICRNTSTSETAATCNNGLDDDCDGFIDGADSDCSGTERPPKVPMAPATRPDHTAGTTRKNATEHQHQ